MIFALERGRSWYTECSYFIVLDSLLEYKVFLIYSFIRLGTICFKIKYKFYNLSFFTLVGSYQEDLVPETLILALYCRISAAHNPLYPVQCHHFSCTFNNLCLSFHKQCGTLLFHLSINFGS
jgi:hypothetical protein